MLALARVYNEAQYFYERPLRHEWAKADTQTLREGGGGEGGAGGATPVVGRLWEEEGGGEVAHAG